MRRGTSGAPGDRLAWRDGTAAARRLPRQAGFLAHRRTGRWRERRRRQPLRRAQAPCDRRPLRPAAAARRGAEELGGAEGAVARPGREAARGRDRGPSARVHRLRGVDPGRRVWRRPDDRLGHRDLGADGRSRGGPRQGGVQVPAGGREARRRLDADPAEAAAGREAAELAPVQGARPRSGRDPRHPRRAAGEREERAADRGAGRAGSAGGEARAAAPGGIARGGQGAGAGAADAAAGEPGRGAARGRRLAARDQARRLPDARVRRGRRGAAHHARWARLDAPLRGPRRGVPAAALPGGGRRRRDRGAGRGRGQPLRAAAGRAVARGAQRARVLRLRPRPARWMEPRRRAAPAAEGAAGAAPRRGGRAVGDPDQRPRARGRRGLLRAGVADGARGGGVEARRRALPAGAVEDLGEVQGKAVRGLRDRGLHGVGGGGRARGAGARGLGRRRARLSRQGRDRVRRARRSPTCWPGCGPSRIRSWPWQVRRRMSIGCGRYIRPGSSTPT